MTRQVDRAELAWAAALTLLGVAARLVWLEVSTGGDWSLLLYPDEANYYLDAARRISREGAAYFGTVRSLWNGPVNPLWILAWSLYPPAVKLANVVLLALAGLMVWDLARRELGRAAGLWSLGLCTAHPPLAVFGPTLLTEAPFLFLLVLSVHALLRAERPRAALAGGAVAGLATLTRPTLQLWPFLLFFTVLLTRRAPAGLRGTRRRWLADPRIAAAFLAGHCAVVGPWVAKNAYFLGRPVVANAGFGGALYLGNDLKKDGDEPVYAGMDFDTWAITAPHTHLDAEGDRRLVARALAGMRAHPAATARLWVEKVARCLVGYPTAYFFPARDLPSALRQLRDGDRFRAILEPATTVLAAVLGLAGLARFGSGLSGLALGSLIAYVVALHVVTFAIPRLVLPMFPALAFYAGGFIAAAWERVRAGSAGVAEAVPPAVALAILAAMSFWNVGKPAAMVSQGYAALFESLEEQRDFSHWAPTDLTRHGDESLVATGPGPALEGRVGPVAAAPNQVVFVVLSAAPAEGEKRRLGLASLAWDAGDGFAQDPLGDFQVRLDGRAHLYRVSPSRSPRWRGTIRALRLAFPGARRGTAFRVGRLVVAR